MHPNLEEPTAASHRAAFIDTVRDVDEMAGIVDAYWALWDVEGSDGVRFSPGAFTATIAQRGPEGTDRIRMLWQHDSWTPIGRPRELLEDDRGLRAVCKVAPTTRGRDALILYREGVIQEHSIGYVPLDIVEGVTTLATVWEGSAVTWGAEAGARTVSVRAGAGDDLVGLRLRANAARAALSAGLMDDTASALELAIARADAALANTPAVPAGSPLELIARATIAGAPSLSGSPGADAARNLRDVARRAVALART